MVKSLGFLRFRRVERYLLDFGAVGAFGCKTIRFGYAECPKVPKSRVQQRLRWAC